MSTICGMVSYGHKDICLNDFSSMINYLGKFPESRVFKSEDKKICLGNTIQPITAQDKMEQLPRYSLSNKMVIVADAIIDNREELYHDLQLDERPLNNITNSELILEAYIRWDKEVPTHLIGDFAFAIWNSKKEELYLCRDHVGKRTLYYMQEDNTFAFSTLIKPLLLIKNSEFSEQWIANYLAVVECINELDPELTFYEGIKQIPPATYMIFTNGKAEVKKYWSPLSVKQLKLSGDDAYEEAFRKVFFEAVNCRIAAVVGEIGIMVSGGLDSGSVACVAAQSLDHRSKHLKAYSSIPKPDYINWLPKGIVADESRYINELAIRYPNIDLTFCTSDKLNSYNQLEHLALIQEYPYKYSANLFWIDRIAQMAKEDGCKVLLDGQSGNLTISYGDITSHIFTLISKMKFYTAYKEIVKYSRLYHKIPQSVIKYFVLLYVPKFIKDYLKRTKSVNTYLITHLINNELADKWKINKLLKKYSLGKYFNKRMTVKDVRKFNCNGLLFSQAGAAETRLSVEYGVVRRDPTRDKRVIEFCMSLPAEQFVKDGIERSLIRRSMKGILPDLVRMNLSERGRQSADWVQRLHEDWESIRREFLQAITDNRMKSFVDTPALKEMLLKMNELPRDEEYYEVQAMITIINLYRFLNSRT